MHKETTCDANAISFHSRQYVPVQELTPAVDIAGKDEVKSGHEEVFHEGDQDRNERERGVVVGVQTIAGERRTVRSRQWRAIRLLSLADGAPGRGKGRQLCRRAGVAGGRAD